MANNRHYTKEEEKFLIENYKKQYTADLAKQLNRTPWSVFGKAVRLGLTDKSKRADNWTPDEISTLKNNYQKIGLEQTCKLLENRTQTSVQTQASKLGFALKKTPSTSKSRRASKLKCKYGITLDEYDKMFEQQCGVCAICFQYETQQHQNGAILRLAVDHSHTTGKIRKLLCRSCNLMIANAKENIETLANAINYLKKEGG